MRPKHLLGWGFYQFWIDDNDTPYCWYCEKKLAQGVYDIYFFQSPFSKKRKIACCWPCAKRARDWEQEETGTIVSIHNLPTSYYFRRIKP